MNHIERRIRQRGLGLVELMIAITLSLMLSAAVIQVFVSTKTNYRLQDAVGSIQENGRFAMTYLAEDVRMAGFAGCSTVDKAVVKNWVSGLSVGNETRLDPTSVAFDSTSVITGVENVKATDSTFGSSGTAWNVKPRSDVLIVRHAVSGGASLSSVMATTSANIAVKANSFKAVVGDVLMISDCSNADVFRVTAISGANGSAQTFSHGTASNSFATLSRPYGADAEVLAMQTATYFVRYTTRKTAGGKLIPALFMTLRSTNQGGAVDLRNDYTAELVEGVENMQVLYGVDTDADGNHAVDKADKYMNADEVTTANLWNSVVSVRVNLLMVGNDDNSIPNTTPAQTYIFNGQPPISYDAGDRRMRKEFYSVISVRNRSL